MFDLWPEEIEMSGRQTIVFLPVRNRQRMRIRRCPRVVPHRGQRLSLYMHRMECILARTGRYIPRLECIVTRTSRYIHRMECIVIRTSHYIPRMECILTGTSRCIPRMEWNLSNNGHLIATHKVLFQAQVAVGVALWQMEHAKAACLRQ